MQFSTLAAFALAAASSFVAASPLDKRQIQICTLSIYDGPNGTGRKENQPGPINNPPTPYVLGNHVDNWAVSANASANCLVDIYLTYNSSIGQCADFSQTVGTTIVNLSAPRQASCVVMRPAA